MTSSPNAKPLNPEAKPFRAKHFLQLPLECFYHLQSPPPPPPCYSGPLYHHLGGLFYKPPPPALGCYYVRYHQPPLLQTTGAFAVADSYGGGGGGGVDEGWAESKELVKRKEVNVGVKRVFIETRFRRPRKGPNLGGWRRVSGPTVWMPKTKSNSKSSGGGAATVHPSSPPPPPPSPPPPQQSHKFDDVSCCWKTTVMIKNIPNQFRRNMLLDFLDKHCQDHNLNDSDPLHLAYDFVYLPMDFRSGDNFGYAFVNFTSSGAALKIREMLNDFKWGFIETSGSKTFESKKICEITWARIQGKENLVNHFKNSTFYCGNVEYLPAVLSPARNGSTSSSAVSVLHPIGKCLASLTGKPLRKI